VQEIPPKLTVCLKSELSEILIILGCHVKLSAHHQLLFGPRKILHFFNTTVASILDLIFSAIGNNL
jgi:hypothetical protein